MQILDNHFNIRLIKIKLPQNLDLDIQQLKGAVTSNRASNQGGFQGEPHWARRHEYPWMTPLMQTIEQTVKQTQPNVSLFRIWFNINGPGHSNRWHKHSRDELVSVTYVSATAQSGCIEFRDGEQTFAYSPQPGDILIFPGHIEHSVGLNQSDSDRISIACNFKIK